LLVDYSYDPNRHGCRSVVIHVLDPRFAKALSHPLRQRILQRLNEGGVASPNELARALGEALGSVSYHIRILRELDCVELVSTTPRRGALEHYYRATARPGLDDEEWARLPASLRRETLGRILSEIFEGAAKAGLGGGYPDSETHVRRIALALDEQARTELSALLAETHDAALRIDADSASRHAQHGPDDTPAIATDLWLIHLRHADTN